MVKPSPFPVNKISFPHFANQNKAIIGFNIHDFCVSGNSRLYVCDISLFDVDVDVNDDDDDDDDDDDIVGV